jgi:phosphomannomutase
VDFAAAWDADADRVMFLDEKGRFIPGIYITALLSEIMLEKHKGAKIIFDPRVVWPAFDTVNRRGGIPIMAKAGHAFMKDRMRSENAVFAGELSAHYYFRDNYYADNGLIPFLLVLEHLSKTQKSLSEVMAPFMKNHYTSGELNYRVENTEATIAKVKEGFAARGVEDFTDGYAVESDLWRFNVRPSNTEPLLRLNVEARDPKALQEIQKEVVEIILNN